jgi:VWFA-related protein
VDEVSILFRAADVHGLTVSDLKPQELDLFDDEEGPRHILSLQPLADRPVFAGFLMDVSGSVTNYVWESRALAAQVAQKLMVRTGDSGLVISFGRSRQVILPWNDQQKSVLAAISQIGPGRNVAKEGTGVFDALFDTCHYEFGGQRTTGSQHVILLFSDGEDTASYMSLRDAVDACQRAHTVVYAFAPKLAPGTVSTGPVTLQELTERTSGRVIRADVPEAERKEEIERLINDLRQEYQLFYRPRGLKHDGAFHRITLVGPKRVTSIDAQSGYYAPTR